MNSAVKVLSKANHQGMRQQTKNKRKKLTSLALARARSNSSQSPGIVPGRVPGLPELVEKEEMSRANAKNEMQFPRWAQRRSPEPSTPMRHNPNPKTNPFHSFQEQLFLLTTKKCP
jgi:hypothetical protein